MVLGQRQRTTIFIQLPRHNGGCKEDSNEVARSKFVNRKANIVSALLEKSMPQGSAYKRHLRTRVIRKVAEDHGLVVIAKGELILQIAEVVTLLDLAGISTNGIYRLKSGLETLRLIHRGCLLPPGIKKLLAQFEAEGNLNITVTMCDHVTSKENSKQNGSRCAHLMKSWFMIALMINKAYQNNTFETSQDWDKLVDKLFTQDSVDKGGLSTGATLRCMNVKGGNSMKYTFTIGTVDDGTCESYLNEAETSFNKILSKNPAPYFLQCLSDNRFWTLTIKSSDNKSCQSIVVDPLPHRTPIGIPDTHTRSLHVELLPGNVLEKDLQFDLDISSVGGPPQLLFSSNTMTIQVKLVHENNASNMIVGVQLIFQGLILNVQRFFSPLLLKMSTPSKIKTKLQQVIGIPCNDRKQRLIQAGMMSSSCSYNCDGCILHKEMLHVMPTNH